MVICLQRGADLHVSQLRPLPLAVSCFSKIQIGFTFLVTEDPGSPGKSAVKWVCLCACVLRSASEQSVMQAVGTGANGESEPSGDKDCRGGNDSWSGVECDGQESALSLDISRGIEENALRDAIYRSSRSGWTSGDRGSARQTQVSARCRQGPL